MDIEAILDYVVAYSAEVAHRAVLIRQSLRLVHDTGCMLYVGNATANVYPECVLV